MLSHIAFLKKKRRKQIAGRKSYTDVLTKLSLTKKSQPRYTKLNLTLVKSTVNFAIFHSNCLATSWLNKPPKILL